MTAWLPMKHFNIPRNITNCFPEDRFLESANNALLYFNFVVTPRNFMR